MEKKRKRMSETNRVLIVILLELILFVVLLLLSKTYQEYVHLPYSVEQNFFQNNPVALLVLIVAVGVFSIVLLVYLLKSMVEREMLLKEAAMDVLKKLRVEQERYHIVTEISHDIVVEYDFEADVIEFSDLYKKLYGHDVNRIEDFSKKLFGGELSVHPEDIPMMRERLAVIGDTPVQDFQFRMENINGRYVWCHFIGQVKTGSDGKRRMYGMWSDIDALKNEMNELEKRAKLDPLTGVFNKGEIQRMIRKTLAEHPEKQHALAIFDLDDFKDINDKYGHLYGDRVLIYIANLFKVLLEKNEFIGRFGGDEFIVFFSDCKDRETAEKKVRKLFEAKQVPYCDADVSIPLSLSIGAACTDGREVTLQELLEKADAALYEVKKQGKNGYRMQ